MEHTRTKWDDETIERELRAMAAVMGNFPSASEMRDRGRNDLACAVTKRGGSIFWSEKLGIPRKPSDSDLGWEGEHAFVRLCAEQGLSAERVGGVKNAWDIEVQGALRVDVKTAKRHVYKVTGGWHYRVGKRPQADVVVLYQLDTGDFFGVPWWLCPATNMTIMDSGGKYAAFKNDWPLLKQMLGMRLAEMARVSGAAVADVA